MFARIKSAAERGILVTIIYRVDKVDSSELRRLKEIKNVELKYTTDLHAKCYFNEFVIFNIVTAVYHSHNFLPLLLYFWL